MTEPRPRAIASRPAAYGRIAHRSDAGWRATDLQASARRPHGELRVLDLAAVWRIVFGGEPGAGEAFMDGLLDSPDLSRRSWSRRSTATRLA